MAASNRDFLPGGAMGDLMRAHDWTRSPLGRPSRWPPALKSTVRLMLPACAQIVLFWGQDYVALYNDAYAPTIGDKHPRAMGRPARENWAELWDDLEPLLNRVRETGETVFAQDRPFYIERHGYGEDVFFDISYSAVRGDDGAIGGVLCIVNETTEKVLAMRRQTFLIELADALRDAPAPGQTISVSLALLGRHLNVSGCGYGEIDATGLFSVVADDWVKPGFPSVAGQHRLDDYGEAAIGELRAGRTARVRDVLTHPWTAGDAAGAFMAQRTRSFVSLPLHVEGRLAAIFFARSEEPRNWADHEIELIRNVTERIWQAMEKIRAQRALRESEARFRNMADHAPVMIWTTDELGCCTYLSRSWHEFTGQNTDEALAFGWLNATHPEDQTQAFAAFRRASIAGEPFRLEYRLRRADGEYRWAIDAAAPRFGGNGQFLGYVGSVIDITERKQAEERQQLLTNELDHRVKNTLAVIQAIAAQTGRFTPEPEAFREAFGNRLVALARVHDVLTKTAWAGAALGDVAAAALAPFTDGNGETLQISGPPALLQPNAAVILSLGLHELATNATKYGALSIPGGYVALQWRIAAGAPSINLEWAEHDGPPVVKPRRTGFGSRIINSMAVQLGGEVTLDFKPGGLRCSIVMPLAAASG